MTKNKTSSSPKHRNKNSKEKNFKYKSNSHSTVASKQKNAQKKQLKNTTTVEELDLDQQARYVAMDCEFVGIGPGGHESALARVSIVDFNNKVLLDTYVKVHEPVTDYRTFVSGVTEEHLQSDLAMDAVKCVATVQNILHGKILVGHGLKNDLKVMGIDHPWYDTRDTAKYEPFMKKEKRDSCIPFALPRPRKLKDLALTKLNRIIQKEGEPHCSIEDAIAALDLYKKARAKWENVIVYKINRTFEIVSENAK